MKKRYTVDLLGWYGGEFKSFWLLKNAIKWAKENRDELWIDLKDNWTGKEVRLKNTNTQDWYRTEDGEYKVKQ